MKIKRIFVRFGRVTLSASDVSVPVTTLISIVAVVAYLFHPVM